MLFLGITYVENECERRHHIVQFSEVNIDELMTKPIAYIEVLNERFERDVLFCISGVTKLCVHELANGEKGLFMYIGNWSDRIPHNYRYNLYLVNKQHIVNMLKIVEKNEKRGINKTKDALENYARHNGFCDQIKAM